MARSLLPAFVLLSTLAAASAGSVPRDFTLHAHFWPGGMPDYSMRHSRRENPEPWDLTLASDGKARRDVFVTVLRHNMIDSQRERTSLQLSASKMASIVEALLQSDFFTLPAVIPTNPFLEHARVLSISVRMAGQQHAVEFYCMGKPRHTSAAKRLGEVWRGLFRALSSPNQNVELACFP